MTGTVSLIIPTYNRAAYLDRLLFYLKIQKFSHPIYVLDGSPDEYGIENQTVVQKHNNFLDIHYEFHPKTEPYLRIYNKLKDITTPYVVINNDDDFVLPSMIEKGIAFLENNPDYSVFHGRTIVFDTQENEPLGDVVEMREFRQNSLSQESSLERVCLFHSDYNSLWRSVQRTDLLAKAFQISIDYRFDHFFSELYPSLFCTAKGKIKRDSSLYSLITGNNPRYFDRSWYQAKLKWVLQPDWHEKCLQYINSLSEIICEIDKADYNHVYQEMVIGFENYLAGFFGQPDDLHKIYKNNDFYSRWFRFLSKHHSLYQAAKMARDNGRKAKRVLRNLTPGSKKLPSPILSLMEDNFKGL